MLTLAGVTNANIKTIPQYFWS